jgi:hypothetical protein
METTSGPRRVAFEAGASCPVAVTKSGERVGYTVWGRSTHVFWGKTVGLCCHRIKSEVSVCRRSKLREVASALH